MNSANRSEATALRFALFAATTMIAQQVAGKATRDALFLSNFDVTNLPRIVIAAAIASMAGVLIMSRLLSRYSPATLMPAIFGASTLLFAGEWVLLEYQPGITSIVLYLHMAVFGAILISGFWSIINERFDPHSAKQRVARIAAAAAFGGVIGGLLAERVAALLDVRTMLLVLGGLHGICLFAVRLIGTPTRTKQTDHDVKTRSAFTVIANTRYLQWMAVLMVLVSVMAALADYAFKAEASARYQDSESLIAFFATFYAAVGLLGFILQTLLGRRALQHFGIGATIAILPVVVTVFGSIGAAFTQMWSMTLLRGGHAVFVNSFFRSAFELLYTPLPPHKKRPTKSIIDVASDRLGDMIGGGFILLLLLLSPDLSTAVIAASAVMIALLALYVVNRLNSGYISQLAHSLRKGVVRIDEDDIMDATTRQILAETDNGSEREFLQSRIDTMLEHQDETTAAGNTGTGSDAAWFARAVNDLGSGDADRIRRALSSSIMDIRLSPWIIPLLENDEVVQDIRTELRWLTPRIIGQLTDALLDPDIPLLARQRLPGVLEVSHNTRAINGLLQGMVDESFNVRFSCARALGRMRSRDTGLQIPREQVFTTIRRELDVSAETWEGHDLELQPEETTDDAPGNLHLHRGLEHVFTLLALTLDPDAVHISRQAIFSTDANLRGTALEYLENVLPADLYNKLLDHLGASDEGRK
ncbi:MAG: Npt1/Npt2 family nucleotide transporter, partial [Thiohalobacterales bacterium]